MMKEKILILLLCLLIATFVVGCFDQTTGTQKSAAVGAAVGAVGGQIIGRNTASTLMGAGIGALGGAIMNDAISHGKKK